MNYVLYFLSLDITYNIKVHRYTEYSFFFQVSDFILFIYLFYFNFIFKLYIIVLVLPNIKMNPPQVYMCSPS